MSRDHSVLHIGEHIDARGPFTSALFSSLLIVCDAFSLVVGDNTDLIHLAAVLSLLHFFFLFYTHKKLFPNHPPEDETEPRPVTMKFFTTAFLLLASSAAVSALPYPEGSKSGTSASKTEENASKSSSPASNSGASGGGNNNNNNQNGSLNANLVPDFGVVPNTNPGARQAGSCDGFAAASNSVVNIPCDCPPSRSEFLAALERNVAAGSVQGTEIEFSNDASDQSTATNTLRATAMLVTLQNLNGAGVGCPAASAPNFALQQRTGEVSQKVFVGS